MAPLVIIRSTSNFVEYRKKPSIQHTISNVSSDIDETNTNDHQLTNNLLHLSIDECDITTISNENIFSNTTTTLIDLDGLRSFRCADCANIVADHEDIIAKTFFGSSGKAYLMNNMFNIRIGSPRSRFLMTGMHTIASVFCDCCSSELGWKYIKAMEISQRYKEGKFVMERAVVEDEEEDKEWDRI